MSLIIIILLIIINLIQLGYINDLRKDCERLKGAVDRWH